MLERMLLSSLKWVSLSIFLSDLSHDEYHAQSIHTGIPRRNSSLLPLPNHLKKGHLSSCVVAAAPIQGNSGGGLSVFFLPILPFPEKTETVKGSSMSTKYILLKMKE